MKNIQKLSSIVIFLLVSVVAFAQPGSDVQKSYQDSIKQLEMKRRSNMALEYQAKLNVVSQYNANIDMAIANKDLVEHRLNMNATNKAIVKVGKYNRNVSFFHDEKKSIKKIIILTTYGSDQDYQEFLFDDRGLVYKVSHMPDMSNPLTTKAFYYEDEKLSLYTKDGGKVFGADDVNSFDEDAFQEGVDWLNKAAGYTALFKLMGSLEPVSR
ncbi:MAG: hypothetical protein ACPG19_13825 [Saprospiraceae bacterium]